VFVDPLTNDVVALYRDTGQLLWQVSLVSAASGVAADGGGELPCYQAQVNALALSPTGPIYAAGNLSNLCESGDEALPQPFLAGILPNGSIAWANLLPLVSLSQPFGQGLVVDGQGNSYVYVVLSSAEGDPATEPGVASFDPQGQPRFVLPVSAEAAVLALGTDRLVETSNDAAVGTGEVWSLDGGPLTTLDAGWPLLPTSSVVIDGQNDIYVLGSSGYLGARLAAFAADEPNPIWSFDSPMYVGMSNLVLGQGQLFFASAESCGGCPIGTPTPPSDLPQALTAIDSASGAQLWTMPIATDPYPYPAGTMTLSNTANLILASGAQVTAFFAGQQAPPQNAPWSRIGGSYSNQSSSAPPALPTLPAGSP
jgi:outer membrane protein assembly factor BamB